jgi:hypothetical protein
MRRDFYRKLEGLERSHAAALQAAAYRDGPSGAEVMQALLNRHAIGQLPGESRVETLARAAGISMRELKNLLCGIPSVAPETNVACRGRISTIVGSAFAPPAAIDRKRNASPQRAAKKIKIPVPAFNQKSAIPEVISVQFVDRDGEVVDTLPIDVDKSRAETTGGEPNPAPPADLSVWEALEKAFNTRTEPNQSENLSHQGSGNGDDALRTSAVFRPCER